MVKVSARLDVRIPYPQIRPPNEDLDSGFMNIKSTCVYIFGWECKLKSII